MYRVEYRQDVPWSELKGFQAFPGDIDHLFDLYQKLEPVRCAMYKEDPLTFEEFTKRWCEDKRRDWGEARATILGRIRDRTENWTESRYI